MMFPSYFPIRLPPTEPVREKKEKENMAQHQFAPLAKFAPPNSKAI